MRTQVHKTRKVQLNSHISELQLSKTERTRNLFQTPNLNALYQQEVIQ
ncbi:hypothetical protein [Methanosarcina sp. Kolksee]|nr:hypothetical protein [Methanosarcina sp. Kolksee]